jgi:hypothetical protein
VHSDRRVVPAQPLRQQRDDGTRQEPMPSVPVWVVALGLALVAPWAVNALEAAFQRRLRRRTLALLAQALPGWRETGVKEPGPVARSSEDGAPRKP